MFLETSSEETYEDGQIIFEEGKSGDWIYLVEEGAVELSKIVDGKKVVVEVVRQGEVFGEMAFLARIPRTATARALGRSTLGIMDRIYLDDQYSRLSESFQMIIKSLAVRLKKTTDSLVGVPVVRRERRTMKCLSLSFKDKNALIRSYSHNVSTSGLFIKTAKPLPRGEEFIIQLELPNGMGSVRCRSQVAWVRTETNDPVAQPMGMGVKFLDLSKEDQGLLQAAMA
ncbi:MAG: cyclic nucleotide-binding domain-containing protein [Proteobacteria bacterium]|nr:cyclic nucleotide-binding domain-containing protein [Pseudomonadota bacterium]